MPTRKVKLYLGSVDYDALVSEDDFKREAIRILPSAISSVGEANGVLLWAELNKAFGRKSCGSSKAEFVLECRKKFEREISEDTKEELLNQIVKQLHEESSLRKSQQSTNYPSL